jgi:hypothetical protein
MRSLESGFKYFLLFVLFSSIACNSSNKGENLIHIGASKLDIKTPKNYKQYDINSINKLIESNDTSESIITLNSIKLLLDDDNRTKVYFDTLNYNNFITMKAGPKIPFSTKIIEELSDLTKETILNSYGFLGVKVVIKERALKSAECRYIKMKYKLLMNNKAFYQTNYLLEGMAETIGINVVSNKDEDFEQIIKTLKIN